MDSLFAEGTSPVLKFFIAFIVVFALIGVTAWLIRRFGSGALGGTSTRGRAPRLAVIEAGAVDGRRKLVLIRRDNIEHLIMIGGPTDVLIEANIVRGQAARETAAPRAASATDNLPRAQPVGDDTGWPLQPESAPRNGRAARPAPLDDVANWALPSEPTAPAAPAASAKRSRSAETLAGLAAELSVRPSEPAAPAAPKPAPAPEPARAAKPAPVPAPASSAAADQNLADMASRLEAALRRPAPAPSPPARPAMPPPTPKPAAPAAEAPRIPPVVAPSVAPVAPPPPPPVIKAPEPVVAKAPEPVVAVPAPAPVLAPEKPAEAAKPAPAKDDVFGSIEEEMANLLGRPAGKPS